MAHYFESKTCKSNPVHIINLFSNKLICSQIYFYWYWDNSPSIYFPNLLNKINFLLFKMGAMSKLLDTLAVPTVVCPCREVTHVWHPGCFMAVAGAAPLSFLFSMKTYGTLYCITGLLKLQQTGRFKWKHITINTLRSSAFLTLNMAAYLYFTCKIR